MDRFASGTPAQKCSRQELSTVRHHCGHIQKGNVRKGKRVGLTGGSMYLELLLGVYNLLLNTIQLGCLSSLALGALLHLTAQLLHLLLQVLHSPVGRISPCLPISQADLQGSSQTRWKVCPACHVKPMTQACCSRWCFTTPQTRGMQQSFSFTKQESRRLFLLSDCMTSTLLVKGATVSRVPRAD